MKAESNGLVISSTNIWQFTYISEGYTISPLLGALAGAKFVLASNEVTMGWLILCADLSENFKPQKSKTKEKEHFL